MRELKNAGRANSGTPMGAGRDVRAGSGNSVSKLVIPAIIEFEFIFFSFLIFIISLFKSIFSILIIGATHLYINNIIISGIKAAGDAVWAFLRATLRISRTPKFGRRP